LGLVGAFVGGMVVRVTGLNFGWGPVLMLAERGAKTSVYFTRSR